MSTAAPSDLAEGLIPFTVSAREASIPSQSFDAASRTFEYVLTTEDPAPAKRELAGKVITVGEVLLMSGCRNVDKIGETPLLNSHRRESIEFVLGTQLGGRIEGDKLICKAKLSGRDAVRQYYDDISEGILQKISVGYTIHDQKLVRNADGTITALVTDWSIDEGSIVPIPADMRAEIRSQRALSVEPQTVESNMSSELEKAIVASLATFQASLLTAVRAAPKPAAQTPNGEPDEAAKAKMEEEKAAQKAKDEAAAAAAAEKAKGKKEDEDGGEGGDDMEKKRSAPEQKAIQELRSLIGPKGNEAFEMMVRHGFPMTNIRNAAYTAVGSVPGARIEIPVDETRREAGGVTNTRDALAGAMRNFEKGPQQATK